MASKNYTIRHATREDVPAILQMIRDLAEYERDLASVQATEETLSNTLSFAIPSSQSAPSASPNPAIPASQHSSSQTSFTPGYAKTLLLLTPDGQIAGMGMYFYNYSTWTSAPGIYLEDLFVKPEYRKRGYGKAIIKELAQEVVRVGGARLQWSCLNWNKPSLEFYQNLGAHRKNEWVGLQVDGEALTKLAHSQSS